MPIHSHATGIAVSRALERKKWRLTPSISQSVSQLVVGCSGVCEVFVHSESSPNSKLCCCLPEEENVTDLSRVKSQQTHKDNQPIQQKEPAFAASARGTVAWLRWRSNKQAISERASDHGWMDRHAGRNGSGGLLLSTNPPSFLPFSSLLNCPHCVLSPCTVRSTWFTAIDRFLRLRSYVRSFVRSFVGSFLPSFLPSFVPSFLLSFVPSFLRSFVCWFIPSFLLSFIPSFLRSFVPRSVVRISFLRLLFVRSFVRLFASFGPKVRKSKVRKFVRLLFVAQRQKKGKRGARKRLNCNVHSGALWV